MAQKNKLSVMVARRINDYNVSKRRRVDLKINYYKGLIEAYLNDANLYLVNETKYINALYDKKIEPLQIQLDGQSLNDMKRQKKLNNYDQKNYWRRRKYKTSLLRKESKETCQQLLDIWDQQLASDREQFEQQLKQDFPHQEMSQIDIDTIKTQINQLIIRKEQHLDRIKAKHQKKLAKIHRFKKGNDKRLEKLSSINKRLEQSILKYSQMRFEDDKQLLKDTEEKLALIKGDKTSYTASEEKSIHVLEQKIEKIKTVMAMLEDKNIHLSLTNLKMFFGGVKAVNDLTFNVKRGEIFGLIGPNGAGKTTVFNCITQFYKATDGQMIFKNKEDHIVDLRQYKTHDMISEGIARSFQNVELIWELTVLDNLLVAAHSLIITNFFDHMVHTPKWKREELVLRTKGLQILKDLGIIEYAFRSPYGLPYGVLKKVELARTLMTNPSLIILDEPAAGLNDAETEELARVIKKINQAYNVTLFLVEHDMGLVMSICDTICAISFGKRIGLGTPKDIQENPEVRKAYLGDDTDE